MDVRTVDLADEPAADRPALAAALYDGVLRPAFPDNELIPWPEFARGLEGAPALHVAGAFIGDEPLAVVVGQWFARSRVLLIAYLAVRAVSRGQGVGSALVGTVLSGWADRLGAQLVVAEVEDPAAFSPKPGQDPAARLRLYDRLGAERIDLPYVQPEVNRGQGRVSGMFLIVPPALSPCIGNGVDGHRLVPAPLLRAFLADYFAAAEGGEPDDDQYHALVAAVSVTGPGLPLLPLYTG